MGSLTSTICEVMTRLEGWDLVFMLRTGERSTLFHLRRYSTYLGSRACSVLGVESHMFFLRLPPSGEWWLILSASVGVLQVRSSPTDYQHRVNASGEWWL